MGGSLFSMLPHQVVVLALMGGYIISMFFHQGVRGPHGCVPLLHVPSPGVSWPMGGFLFSPCLPHQVFCGLMGGVPHSPCSFTQVFCQASWVGHSSPIFLHQVSPGTSNRRSPSACNTYLSDASTYQEIFGRLRGVRVVPELDTPGSYQVLGKHTEPPNSVLFSRKAIRIVWANKPNARFYLHLLEEIFLRSGREFPDQYLHLGGDEVKDTCWASNPNITAWMKKMGYGQNYSLLEQHYEQNLLSIVEGLGKSYIIWQEVVDNDIKVLPDTVVKYLERWMEEGNGKSDQ
ncbi:hypothetical protein OS493_004771 [Desmophyllum pertusum]|uniref:beta-N-acetylhexosaminidase n=1 Tax=Desmophyllum pertusum TaxID=174260 RepID=A0A9W9ZGA8_9CNID|nr:hypothetical protein OS493_004771 [Desmophyllum pertusum]